jgi:hemolysin III
MADAVLSPSPAEKPRLRGVLHQWAFFVSVPLGAALVLAASGTRATVACAIYASSVALLFGTSATYHRVNWRTLAARRWMRRMDHSAIFVLIAGSYTPFALLTLHGTLSTAILIAVWSGAAGGVLLKLAWIDAPKWLIAVVYIALGWVAAAATPTFWRDLGAVPTLMIGAGGLLYTVGAVVYATQRPDPSPRVFGYHEVFHLLVIAAALLQYAVIAFWVI